MDGLCLLGCGSVGRLGLVMVRCSVGSSVVLMWVAVVLWSLFALVVALVGVVSGPVRFMFWHLVGLNVVYVGWLVCCCRSVLFDVGVWLSVVRGLWGWVGLRAVGNVLQPAVFVWAVLWVDAALVTVVSGGWLVLFVLAQRKYDRVLVGRYGPVLWREWVLFCVAAVGVGLVVLSQSGGLGLGDGWGLVWGVGLAVLSGVCSSWEADRFYVGSRVCYDRVCSPVVAGVSGRFELGCVLVVVVVTNFVGVLLSGVWVLVGSGGFVFSGVVWVLLVGVLGGVGGLCFRYANLLSSSLGVNAIVYAESVLSLVLLWWLVSVGVVRVDWFVLGAASVVAVNVLVGLRGVGR